MEGEDSAQVLVRFDNGVRRPARDELGVRPAAESPSGSPSSENVARCTATEDR